MALNPLWTTDFAAIWINPEFIKIQFRNNSFDIDDMHYYIFLVYNTIYLSRICQVGQLKSFSQSILIKQYYWYSSNRANENMKGSRVVDSVEKHSIYIWLTLQNAKCRLNLTIMQPTQ